MSQNEQDEPLDPAVEAIRVKMVRLLMVSGGIMMIGLMAVLIAVVYKINYADVDLVEGAAGNSTVKLPAGAKLVSTTPFAEGVALVIKTQDGKTLLQRLDNSGAILSTITIIED